MGKEEQTIILKLAELYQQISINWDCSLISSFHYWENKLANLHQSRPKDSKVKPIDYGYKLSLNIRLPE